MHLEATKRIKDYAFHMELENLDLVFESQISKKKSGFYSRDRFLLRNSNLDYMDFFLHF